MLSSREAGRLLTARDEDYRSTSLAWTARLPDDEPWAGSTRAREAPAERAIAAS
jgi:hypothetical protein